ncbi:MAG: Abi family protein [Scardovia wiggsiae]|uniref:Abi family protein n=1 Tax=Scardovia wiggsiae TaxID=230143 RepID=UPI0036235011
MKAACTLDDFIKLMEEDRGLVIEDKNRVRGILFDCNYYRLSGYFRVFQKDPVNGNNSFKANTRFDDFYTPYYKDEKLRALILGGISLFEITLRSRFAYLSAHAQGPEGYLYANNYNESFRKGLNGDQNIKLLKEIKDWIKKSDEVCIHHFKRRNEAIPVWTAVEVLPFGVISKILSLYRDRDVLAQLYSSLGLRKFKFTAQSIHAMVYLRNICAHHSRLWYKEMSVSPTVPKMILARFGALKNSYSPKSVWQSLLMLMYFVDTIRRDQEFSRGVIGLAESSEVYLAGLKHPLHWKE